MTYLVFSLESGELVGYFALALRPFTLPLSEVTKSQRNRLRCCGLTALPKASATAADGSNADGNNSYTASAVLVGQLGRNYATEITDSISGSELLDLAVERIHDIQDLAGGGLVIVEAEDRQKLIDFYERNGFKRFGIRHLSSTNPEAETVLIQMFKVIGIRRVAPPSESLDDAAETRKWRLPKGN